MMKGTCKVLIFGLLVLAGCSVPKSLQKDKDSNSDSNETLLIYIQQGACLGKCPQYEARFFTGKKLMYEGKKHMPVLGKFEYFVPEEFTKNLIFEALKRNVKLVPDSMPTPPDVPVTRIWVVLNGKMKKMVGWTGGGNGTFKSYADFLQAEVKAMVQEQEGKRVP
jgi:hypothetical protein